MTIEARNLKVGDKYKSGKTIQQVTKIVKISDKTIEFRTNRLAPDYYEGNFFSRPLLSTKIQLV